MSEKKVETLLKELGERDIYSIFPHETVRTLSHYLTRYDVGALVVLDRNKVVGIVSERDITRKVVHKGLSYEIPVKDIMSTDVVSVTPHTNLEECERLMKEYGIRHLPVIANNELLALISIRDLLVSTRLEQEQLAAHYRGYIMPGHSV